MDSKDREEQARWRKRVEGKLTAFESDVSELKSDVRELKSDVRELKSDVRELKSDVRELKSDVRVLKSDVRVLKSDVSELKEGQIRADDTLAFIVKTLDRYQAENRRYMEVLIEQHKSDRAGQGEGIRANRERLEDHELRIRNLEAS